MRSSRPCGEAELWQLIESLPHFVWTCRPSGACDYLSPQWVEYTGIPEADQLGSAWLEQLHPDDQEITSQRWAAAASEVVPLDTVFRIRARDGSYRWFQSRAVPVKDADGTVVKWLGSNTDIQDLYDAQQSQALNNQGLEQIVEQRTQQLTDANIQLEVAQGIAGLGTWSFDIASGEVEWSESLFRVFGLDPTQAPPNYAVQESLFSAESWVRLQAAITAGVQHGTGYELELSAQRTDGEVRTAIARARAFQDAQGNVVRLVGTFHDVTELVRAKNERQAALERLQLATRSAGIGMWNWDLLTNQLTWDERMYTLHGVPPGSPTSYEVWREAVAPHERERAERAVQQALAGEVALDTEFRCVLQSGERRMLRAAAQVIVDDDGSPIRMVGVNWDVTAERRVECELRASRALLTEFVRHAPAAIAMLDQDMRYVQTSDRWLVDYHLEGLEIIGRSLYDLSPLVPARWEPIYARVLAGAVERCAEEAVPQGDDDVLWLQWEARPWLDSDGAVGGMILFTQDISQRKQMEAALEHRTQELERSNQDLERFAYAASHDLQEPLRAVAGCAQLLQAKYAAKLDATGLELIAHMVDGAGRMRSMITDLLAYSRVTSRGEAFKRIRLSDAVAGAITNLQTAIDEINAQVVVGDLPDLAADGSQITALFQNLIGNALKYRGDAPTEIRVSAERLDGNWVIHVSDNGIGMEEQYLSRIFQLFQRLHTRDEFPGSGLGLALCERIVQRHGGRIWATSTLGVGSTFSFYLGTQATLATRGIEQ